MKSLFFLNLSIVTLYMERWLQMDTTQLNMVSKKACQSIPPANNSLWISLTRILMTSKEVKKGNEVSYLFKNLWQLTGKTGWKDSVHMNFPRTSQSCVMRSPEFQRVFMWCSSIFNQRWRYQRLQLSCQKLLASPHCTFLRFIFSLSRVKEF